MFWRRTTPVKLCVQYARRKLGSSGHHHEHHDAHAHGHGSGHGHGHHAHEPHVSHGHELVGKILLVGTYLWIFYKLKEDKGQLFGLYKPWEHEHEHEHELKFAAGATDSDMPSLIEEEH